jgi:uncharacterized protein YqjF (DUF2071 family)
LKQPFLTAEWRHLVMINFRVDPALLQPHVPAGTELDFCEGHALVSVVGFRFLNTRVRGYPIPFHRHFDEVNLRMYVRREERGKVRHGVTFIRELVPRWAIAAVARAAYNEPYVHVPMTSDVTMKHGRLQSATYRWQTARGDCELHAELSDEPFVLPVEGSEACFVTEHYWGYTRQRDGSTIEYEVQHPKWSVCSAARAHLQGDTSLLYESKFAEVLKGQPCSAWVADGSGVIVFHPRKLALRGYVE